ARNHGVKLVVLSPDFSEVARYADWWVPVHAGMDAAFWMGVNHVILREFHADRQVPYFTQYLKRFSDSPFLVELQPAPPGQVSRRREPRVEVPCDGRLVRRAKNARRRDRPSVAGRERAVESRLEGSAGWPRDRSRADPARDAR